MFVVIKTIIVMIKILVLIDIFINIELAHSKMIEEILVMEIGMNILGFVVNTSLEVVWTTLFIYFGNFIVIHRIDIIRYFWTIIDELRATIRISRIVVFGINKGFAVSMIGTTFCISFRDAYDDIWSVFVVCFDDVLRTIFHLLWVAFYKVLIVIGILVETSWMAFLIPFGVFFEDLMLVTSL